MARKARSKKMGRPKGSGVLGHVQMIVSVRADQRETLLDLAEKRREPGAARAPVSEVVRDLLDLALRRRGGRRIP